MARRKQSLFEYLIEVASKLPWWAGVALAAIAYAWLHHLASSDVTALVQPGQMGEFADQTFFKTLASFGQYVLPSAFVLGAAMSVYGRRQRRALQGQLSARPERGALDGMSWQHFEALVGEAFRRRGYKVTGKGGANGGADLALKKGSETFFVQCKQWRALKVGVNTVRELHEVMTAKGATGGFVVTSGVFTDEARAFAKGKNVELMDGKALQALIRGVSVPARIFRDPLSVLTTGAPFCPVCQSRMVRRTAKSGANTGKEFWGCSRYPDCTGKRPAG